MVKCPSCDSEVTIDTILCPKCGVNVQDAVLERVIPVFRRPKTDSNEPIGKIRRLIYIYFKPAEVYQEYVAIGGAFGPAIFFILPVILMSLIYPVFWTHVPIIEAINPNSRFLMMFSGWLGVFLFEMILSFFLVLTLTTIYHLGARLVGGKGKWRQSWGITCFALAPVVIGRIIGLILLWVTPIPGIAPISVSSLTSSIGGILFSTPQWNLTQIIERVFFIWTGLWAAIGIRERYEIGIPAAILIAALGTFIFVNLSSIGFAVPLT